MKKLFVSLPMRGREEKVVLQRMEDIKTFMEAETGEKLKLIDSYFKKIPKNVGDERCWCLGDSIKLMSSADIVVFDVGYRDANGCCIEYEAAKRYGFADRYIIRKDGKIQKL